MSWRRSSSISIGATLESVDSASYEDPLIGLVDGVLVIRAFYFPLATAKRIRLSRVHEASERPLGTWTGRLRIWGSSDFRHWFNLDAARPNKTRAFVLDLGGWVRPVVTPDDPDRFAGALEAAGVVVRRSRAE